MPDRRLTIPLLVLTVVCLAILCVFQQFTINFQLRVRPSDVLQTQLELVSKINEIEETVMDLTKQIEEEVVVVKEDDNVQELIEKIKEGR